MTKYRVARTDPSGTVRLFRIENDDTSRYGRTISSSEVTPERSLRLRNHSPTGFEYGYGGSGAAQLALAILLDAFNGPMAEGRALENYQEFKRAFIEPRQEADGFEITQQQIVNWVTARILDKGPR